MTLVRCAELSQVQTIKTGVLNLPFVFLVFKLSFNQTDSVSAKHYYIISVPSGSCTARSFPYWRTFFWCGPALVEFVFNPSISSAVA